MTTRLLQPVRASTLCGELGLDLLGPDRELTAVCRLEDLDEQGLSFALSSARIPSEARGVVFSDRPPSSPGLAVIVSPAPRLDFIRAQHRLKRRPGFERLSTRPSLHATVEIGPHAVIEDGVWIGEGTVVGAGAVIKTGTRIGRCCEIKPGAVIGEEGFGFERDERGFPLRMVHLGGVSIGDHVDIGSQTTINRGALGDTVIGSHAKLSDHVHVAHNCRVGEGTIIAAGSVICGSVTIGKGVWVSPNCTVRQKLEIGDGSFLGLGSVVVREVAPASLVYGVPARPRLPDAGAPPPPAVVRLN